MADKPDTAYFLNIVEESVQHPDFAGCVGGRVEVWAEGDEHHYAIDELRFLTRKREEFDEFRDRWDGEDVGRQQLGRLAVELRMRFRDGYK